MATPMTTTRTNYFKVTDKEKFMDIMGRVYPVEGEIEIWQKENDPKQVAFTVCICRYNHNYKQRN